MFKPGQIVNFVNEWKGQDGGVHNSNHDAILLTDIESEFFRSVLFYIPKPQVNDDFVPTQPHFITDLNHRLGDNEFAEYGLAYIDSVTVSDDRIGRTVLALAFKSQSNTKPCLFTTRFYSQANRPRPGTGIKYLVRSSVLKNQEDDQAALHWDIRVDGEVVYKGYPTDRFPVYTDRVPVPDPDNLGAGTGIIHSVDSIRLSDLAPLFPNGDNLIIVELVGDALVVNCYTNQNKYKLPKVTSSVAEVGCAALPENPLDAKQVNIYRAALVEAFPTLDIVPPGISLANKFECK